MELTHEMKPKIKNISPIKKIETVVSRGLRLLTSTAAVEDFIERMVLNFPKVTHFREVS